MKNRIVVEFTIELMRKNYAPVFVKTRQLLEEKLQAAQAEF